MRLVAHSPDRSCQGTDLFLAVLVRLQREAQALNQQLDRLEGEFAQVLRDLAVERFEEYR